MSNLEKRQTNLLVTAASMLMNTSSTSVRIIPTWNWWLWVRKGSCTLSYYWLVGSIRLCAAYL